MLPLGQFGSVDARSLKRYLTKWPGLITSGKDNWRDKAAKMIKYLNEKKNEIEVYNMLLNKLATEFIGLNHERIVWPCVNAIKMVSSSLSLSLSLSHTHTHTLASE